MRKFKLHNSLSQVMDLNVLTSFLNEPQGLGFKTNNSYISIGTQYIQTLKEHRQAEPSGKVKFNTYAEYFNFIKFIQYRPLRLEYIPDTTSYFLECNVKEVRKSEKLTESGWLQAEITFEALGQWYKQTSWSSSTEFDNDKTYVYKYPFVYSASNINQFIYNSNSVIDSPCDIVIFGPCENPRWEQKVNGVVTATGKINCEIPEGHKLVISSVAPFYIWETDNNYNKIQNRYQDSDFDTERFMFIRIGENRITFNNDQPSTLKVFMNVYEYYEGV